MLKWNKRVVLKLLKHISEINMKYLGIDWGEKRIGLAMGDSELKLATPYKVVADINEIKEVVKREKIVKIILGKPVKMAGYIEELAPAFLEFTKSLKAAVVAPVELVDERLSSKAADALPGDKKNKSSRDAVAAMIILQSYFDLDAK